MTETPDHDEAGQLLVATAAGDSAAFERLYRTTSPRLFGVCLRIVPQRGEAEDVLQEVFTSVWRKAAQFDPQRARGLTWLTMIARNKAIDHLRARAPARQSVALDDVGELHDDGRDPLAETEWRVAGRRLDVCMGELEPPRGELIRTAFFEGITYEELAKRSGTPLGTVKSWIRRGLAKLKACLER
ncbi:sigma-70 family RNA polymerase sigma factor [Xanthomonas hyacinthi]|uniref:RNA polymerase subunit sigma n=1 Tax=Xanthomonas hyacinthi TaxID=56455 RepID=A0A2S7ETD4_9XANT|nr:sigma-70 family RNA polymerase sigma factor [Xanthomonas hyacinthi]KLD78506.1 RNA polymerase sigma factor [Xanthomonas hyacinthi DSM 19077]PPU96408.1 RNA polymerase subunit sigma [Xanthomonas hyacinthi]QGY78936.1 sigma-70 family RNA polymerase sigma factor [Xanthomonas hyacinthi]